MRRPIAATGSLPRRLLSRAAGALCCRRTSAPPPSAPDGGPVKRFDSIGPSPRVVRMFLAEKGMRIPLETVDMMGGENRRPPYTERGPSGQLPCLELDDGSHLSEITAICEYLPPPEIFHDITPRTGKQNAALISYAPRAPYAPASVIVPWPEITTDAPSASRAGSIGRSRASAAGSVSASSFRPSSSAPAAS